MRNIVEDIVHIIGEKENEVGLLKANISKQIKFKPLKQKIVLLKELNLIDRNMYNVLSILVSELNSLIYDDDIHIDYVYRMFLDTIMFIKYFVYKYENQEEFIKNI